MIAEYILHPRSEVIHLTGGREPRTICGLHTTDEWERGDATMSGLVATCKKCRAIFRRGQP